MKKNSFTLELGEEAEPYLQQAAWMARIVTRISAVFALAVMVAAWMIISAMADSGFTPFEILLRPCDSSSINDGIECLDGIKSSRSKRGDQKPTESEMSSLTWVSCLPW